MNGSDFLDNQPDGRGGYSGPRLQGPLFVPDGMGVIFTAPDGTFWQLMLAKDADGNLILDDNSVPTLGLIQVAR